MSNGEPIILEYEVKDEEIWELVPVIAYPIGRWANQENLDEAISLTGQKQITLSSVVEQWILRKSLSSEIPSEFLLSPAYPNPFNPITTLRYDLPSEGYVTLAIYDINGREINQLVNTVQSAGHKSVRWNATDSFGKPVSAGVYLYQIRVGEFVQTRKMVLLQ